MALPTSIQTGMRGRYSGAGITVEMYPSTVRGLSVELQYATANSTATSVWASVLLPPSSVSALRHTIPVPESTRLWYMKARHPAQQGYSAGSFTPTINARAKTTPHIQRPILPQMTYQGNVEIPTGSDIYVSTAKRIRAGSQPTTGTITKTLRMHAAQLVPILDNGHWNINTLWAQGRLANIDAFFVGPLVLPVGVTVTAIRARTYRETTNDTAVTSFLRAESDATVTLVSTTETSTGWNTRSSSALTESVTTARNYTVFSQLKGVAASSNARLQWLEVDYKMPTYDRTY